MENKKLISLLSKVDDLIYFDSITTKRQEKNETLCCKLQLKITKKLLDEHGSVLLDKTGNNIGISPVEYIIFYKSGNICYMGTPYKVCDELNEKTFHLVIQFIVKKLFKDYLIRNSNLFDVPLRIASYLKPIEMSDYWKGMFKEKFLASYLSCYSDTNNNNSPIILEIIVNCLTPFICTAIVIEKIYKIQVDVNITSIKSILSYGYNGFYGYYGDMTISESKIDNVKISFGKFRIFRNKMYDIFNVITIENYIGETSYKKIMKFFNNKVYSSIFKSFLKNESQQKTIEDIINENKGKLISAKFGI